MSVDSYCPGEQHASSCAPRQVHYEPRTSQIASATGPEVQREPTALRQNTAPKYYCTYCAPAKHVSFKRRSDWKKHETLKHEPGKLYTCAHSKDPHDPCSERFHSPKTVQEHHASVHERRGCTKQCSASRVSHKVVFACGFRGCHRIFLTQPSKDVDVWDERCKHVGEHFELGADVKDWQYSRMILNLLQQETLCSLWDSIASQSNRAKGLSHVAEYRWNRACTERFCNLLETTLWKHMDGRLSLHLNAVTFLGKLYQEAELILPTVSGPARSSSANVPSGRVMQSIERDPPPPELPINSANMLAMEYKELVGYDMCTETGHIAPSPAAQHVSEDCSYEGERKAYAGYKTTPTLTLDDLQRQTLDLLRNPDQGWPFDQV